MCPPLQVSLAGASLSQLCAAISTTQDTHTPSAPPWGFLQGPTVHGLALAPDSFPGEFPQNAFYRLRTG